MKSITLLVLLCAGYYLVGPIIGWQGCAGLFLLQWAHNLERHT